MIFPLKNSFLHCNETKNSETTYYHNVDDGNNHTTISTPPSQYMFNLPLKQIEALISELSPNSK